MVEGARLLSEYTVKSCIEGSNPFLSASQRQTFEVTVVSLYQFALPKVAGRTWEIAFGGRYVWLSAFPTALIQIDPRDNTVRRTFTGKTLHILNNVSYGAESLWLLRVAPTG